MYRSILLVLLFVLFYFSEVSDGQRRYTKVTRRYYSNTGTRSNNKQSSYNNSNNSNRRFSNFQNFNGRKFYNNQNTQSNRSNRTNNNRRVIYNRNDQNQVTNRRNFQTRRLDTEARSYGDNSLSRYNNNNYPFFILSGGTFY